MHKTLFIIKDSINYNILNKYVNSKNDILAITPISMLCLDELNKTLSLYNNNNKLPSKWSNKIIDRYIYPIDNGRPALAISKYIDSVIRKNT